MQKALALSSANSLLEVAPPGGNAILNGDFSIAQRGTSFSGLAGGAYTLDRWGYYKTGSMVHAVDQVTDVPSVAQAGLLASNSLRVTCTTASATLASTDFTLIQQRIEGYIFQAIAQRSMVLSFWVKASKTGTYCVTLRNGGLDRYYVAEYTVNAASTWEKKVIYIPASPSGGTWYYDSGIGLAVGWTLAAGSGYQGTAGAWGTGSIFATANQNNACNAVNNTFQLALVQLEPGSVVSDFFKPDYYAELARCRRYYSRTIDSSNNAIGVSTILQAVSAMRLIGEVLFPVSMRAAPTVTILDRSGVVGAVNNYTLAGSVGASAAAVGILMNGFPYIDFPSGTMYLTSGAFYSFRYIADAEL